MLITSIVSRGANVRPSMRDWTRRADEGNMMSPIMVGKFSVPRTIVQNVAVDTFNEGGSCAVMRIDL